jgi:hypothetical protein
MTKSRVICCDKYGRQQSLLDYALSFGENTAISEFLQKKYSGEYNKSKEKMIRKKQENAVT